MCPRPAQALRAEGAECGAGGGVFLRGRRGEVLAMARRRSVSGRGRREREVWRQVGVYN